MDRDGWTLRPQKPLTQVDQVVMSLRADIIACRLMPDTKLHIAALAEQLSVSLGAVREALAALAAEGLVLAQPQKGYRVCSISSQSLSHLVEARVDIECLCLAQAIKHGGMRWEIQCANAHAALALPRGEAQLPEVDCQDSHEAFHFALVSACPNEWLLRMQSSLYRQSERYRRLMSLLGPNDARDIGGEHQALLDAALARDADTACALLSEHLVRTARALLESHLLQPHDV